MIRRLGHWSGVAAIGAIALASVWGIGLVRSSAAASQSAETLEVMPQYGADGALTLPADYRRWVFVGSSIGLAYGEGQPAMEMFHETLLEPTAFDHFVKTGTFREGTMLVLLLHGTGERVLPARRGRFANELHGVEMAVKDSAHRSEGWAYYNFGGMNGIRSTAAALPRASCYNCHVEHAARDNVFLQFYPLLAEAAHVKLPAAASAPPPAAPARATAAQDRAPLALQGLDPVLLVQGREERGKPEIVETRGGYRYEFVSEPNRVRFASDPDRFGIQNKSCPVVPGAAIDPALFAVHKERVYAFATRDCVDEFKRRPDEFMSGR